MAVCCRGAAITLADGQPTSPGQRAFQAIDGVACAGSRRRLHRAAVCLRCRLTVPQAIAGNRLTTRRRLISAANRVPDGRPAVPATCAIGFAAG